jgi:alkylation response protein AidB-like acyl-CoA dehydrogenase
MDFKLSEEQLMLQRTIRKFAQEELKPLSRELDAKPDPMDCFSWELVKKAAALGLRTAGVPTEYDGEGLDILTQVIIAEELGAGDLGFAGMMGQQAGFTRTLALSCNKEQRDEFLPKVMNDDTYFLSTAVTEPDHGTDNQLPYDAPGVTLETFALRKGDEYIINGRKHFISNGGIAKLLLLYARTKKDVGLTKGMSLFLVPFGTPGFSVGKIHDKLGRRLLINAELIFDDVHIPARYLVGKENEGYQIQQRGQAAILNTSSAVLGCLRECYEETLDYAKNRIQGGKPIREHHAIGIKLSKMRVAIEGCRLLLWKNAWALDNNYGYDRKLNYLIKALIDETAVTVANDMVEIFGGMATADKSLPIEKYLRDIYTSLHGWCTSSINLIRGTPD